MRIQNLLRHRRNFRTNFRAKRMSPSAHVVVEQLEPRLLLDAAFDTLTNIAVGAGPNGVATADFNGDGLADMAVANFNGSTVSILLALEGGGFAAPVDYTVGNRPYAITTGDFNGDGFVDLVVTNFEDSDITILQGIGGDGTFGHRKDIPGGDDIIGNKPQGIVAAYLNGDDRLDLAITNGDDNTVIVMYGKAGTSFSNPVTYAVGIWPVGVVSADFNGDGLGDLAVAAGESNNITILYGQKNGFDYSFVSGEVLDAGRQSWEIATADFNNDGRADLAVANYLDNDVSIFYGLEGGGFGNRIDVAVGTSPRGIVVNDFNEDGRLDFAVNNYGDASVSVIYGLRGGGFGKRADYAVGTQPWGIVSGDFNGDQRADLGVSNWTDDNISILHGRIIEKLFTLGGESGYKAVKYQDADDTWVTIKLNGGSATVRIIGDDPIEISVYKNVATVTGDNLKLDSVVLSGTTNRHTLTFKTRGGEIPGATIGSISSDQENVAIESLKAINGKTMDLTGDITIDGKLGKLVLRDVADGHLIDIAGSLAPYDPDNPDLSKQVGPRDKVKIVLAKVADTTINTHLLPISSLTAIEWLDSDGIENDLILAPWISKITAKGKKANAKKGILYSPGNFQADLNLTGADSRGYSLRYAKIAGEISGEWDFVHNVNYIKANDISADSTITAAGFIKKIYARESIEGSVTALWFGTLQTKGVFTARVTATGVGAKNVSIGKLYAGRVGDVTVTVPGGIKSIKALDWDAGLIAADWIRNLKMSGKRSESIRGDFGADLILSGINAPRGLALRTAKIAGRVIQTNWSVTGNADRIEIGDTTLWTATFSGDVKSLKLKGYKLSGGQFIAGNLRGSWTSNSLASAFITGRIMNAHMTLNRGVDPNNPKLLALGKLTVKKWIGDGQATEGFNTWILTNGNIGKITTGGMVNAAILAFDGATSYEADLQGDGGDPDGVLDLPPAAMVVDDVVENRTIIKKLTVKGLGADGPYFINSNVAAGQIRTVSLSRPDTAINSIPFGLTTGYIRTLVLKTADGTKKLKNLDENDDPTNLLLDQIIIGDMEVRLV